MNTRFWSIKQHIQHWIDLNDLSGIVSIGASIGSKTGSICLIGNMKSTSFIKKYPILETDCFKGYLTKNQYSDSLISVSFQRK